MLLLVMYIHVHVHVCDFTYIHFSQTAWINVAMAAYSMLQYNNIMALSNYTLGVNHNAYTIVYSLITPLKSRLFYQNLILLPGLLALISL